MSLLLQDPPPCTHLADSDLGAKVLTQLPQKEPGLIYQEKPFWERFVRGLRKIKDWEACPRDCFDVLRILLPSEAALVQRCRISRNMGISRNCHDLASTLSPVLGPGSKFTGPSWSSPQPNLSCQSGNPLALTNCGPVIDLDSWTGTC